MRPGFRTFGFPREVHTLILTNHLNSGGITTYCRVLSSHLVRRGIRVSVISGGGGEAGGWISTGASHRMLPIHTSAEFHPRLWFLAATIARFCREEKVGVIHSQTRTTQVLAALVAAATRIPRVDTCHGFLTRRWWRRRVPLWANRVIAVSRPVAQDLIDGWGVEPGRVRVVPHGIEQFPDDDEIARRRGQLRNRYHLQAGEILAGAIGRLSPVKGYSVMIDAMAILREKCPGLKTLLVGCGPQEKELKSRVREMGLGEKVIFETSAQCDADVWGGFDFFVAPSIQEGFGFSILEAMAASMPIVG
ncbi:MAG: glycosyltransferase family 4 protein, partial [Candidatus Omnitrophica bacterium]|nr:glycosyltransferase family 4 protein [Candidatus Omnitrophota bacterium]